MLREGFVYQIIQLWVKHATGYVNKDWKCVEAD